MTDVPQTSPRSRWRQLGPVGALGVMWTFAPAIAGTLLLVYVAPVSDWLTSWLALGLLVYVAIFVIAGGCGFLPTYAQAIVGGWVFGTAAGLPAALLGFTGAALLGYFIARTVSQHRVEDLINENSKAKAVREMLVGKGPLRTFGVVALVRVPPNSPFALTNLLMASAGVAILPYIFGTMIGMLPRTAVAVIFAAAGSRQGRDIQELLRESPVFFGIGLVAMVIVLLIIGYAANVAMERVERANAQAAETGAVD
jgi:uncharacterized membrane protein YdjX (TVP38/TMEM64 family)